MYGFFFFCVKRFSLEMIFSYDIFIFQLSFFLDFFETYLCTWVRQVQDFYLDSNKNVTDFRFERNDTIVTYLGLLLYFVHQTILSINKPNSITIKSIWWSVLFFINSTSKKKKKCFFKPNLFLWWKNLTEFIHFYIISIVQIILSHCNFQADHRWLGLIYKKKKLNRCS